jgi:hypothetical protein
MVSNSRSLIVDLKRLRCVRAQESRDEPFLWIVGIAIGGDQLTEVARLVGGGEEFFFLQGEPAFWFSRGSHGNTGRRIYRDGHIGTLPGATGLQVHRLAPIPSKVFPGPLPGIFVLLMVLLEEDSVTDDAIEAGHQAFNLLLQREIRTLISGIELKDLLTKGILRAGAEGVTPAEGVKRELESRFDGLKERLLGPPVVDCDEDRPDSLVMETIKEAISDYQTLFENVAAAIDPDDFIAAKTLAFTTDELLAQGRVINIVERLEASHCDTPCIYDLEGELRLSGRIIVQGELPGAQRLRIDAVATAYSRRLQSRFITHIGGTEAGVPWILHRYNAAVMLKNGERQFYVLAPDGTETEVQARQHEVTRSIYLRTVPNWTTADNLLELPALSFYTND